MKKITLTMIVIWSVIAALLLTALVFGLISTALNSSSYMDFTENPNNGDLVFDKSFPISSVERISLELGSDDLVINASDGTDIIVRQYSNNPKDQRILTASMAGSELNISTRLKSPGNFFSWLTTDWNNQRKITLSIPKRYSKALKLKLASGNIDVRDSMNLSSFEMEVLSGDVNADSLINANKASIKVFSGELDLNEGLKTESYEISASSGDLNISKLLYGSGEIKATSGTISLSGVEITDSLKVKVTSGDIELALAGDPSLNFTGESTSGNIDTYFDAVYHNTKRGALSAQTGSEPRKNLNVIVTSGNVRIVRD